MQNVPDNAPKRFPDTPRGAFARSLGGRCPVHAIALGVGPGYLSRLDLYPSGDFEQMQRSLPFALDLGESFDACASSDPTTLVWCPTCVVEAKDRRYWTGEKRTAWADR
ncbi:MAG: hypothetical protein KC636_14960 [Myxococcales bacterium]|nr:hypothetical protein [Myxococcales bacterium]